MEQEQSTSSNWKTTWMIVGGIAGALIGVGAVYLYVRSVAAEQGGRALEPRSVKPVAVVSVGLAILGVLRQIANLGTED